MTELLESAGRHWVAWLASGLLPAGILALVLLLAERLRAPIRPRVWVLLWCMVAARLLWPAGLPLRPGLLPAGPPAIPGLEPPPARSASPPAPPVAAAPAPFAPPGPQAARAAPAGAASSRGPGWPAWLLLAQISGTAAWLAVRAGRTRGLRRRLLLEAPDADLLRRAAEWIEAADLGRPPRIRISKTAPAPLLVGVFRPTVVIPAALVSSPSLRPVLLHEAVHARRRDPLLLAIAELVRAIHVLNPVAWIAVRRIRDWMEDACDEEAARRAGDASAYASALLEVSTALTGPRPRLAFAEELGRSRLARRIQRILEPGPTIGRRAAAGIVLAWAGAAALTLPAGDPAPAAGRGGRDGAGEGGPGARAVRLELGSRPRAAVIEADELSVDLRPGRARLGAGPGREVTATIALSAEAGSRGSTVRLAASEAVAERGPDGRARLLLVGPVLAAIDEAGASLRAGAADASWDAAEGGPRWEVVLRDAVRLDIEGLAVEADRIAVSEGDGRIRTCAAEGHVRVLARSWQAAGDRAVWTDDGTLRLSGRAALTRSGRSLDSGSPLLRKLAVEGEPELVFPDQEREEGEHEAPRHEETGRPALDRSAGDARGRLMDLQDERARLEAVLERLRGGVPASDAGVPDGPRLVLAELERQFVATLERYAERSSREPELKDLYDRMSRAASGILEDRRKEVLRRYVPTLATIEGRLEQVDAEIAKIRAAQKGPAAIPRDRGDADPGRRRQDRREGGEP